MRTRRALASLGAALAALSLSCGPPTVRPAAYTDPDVTCPALLKTWNLEIVDQRADREGAAQMIASVRDGIQTSFPGCRWTNGPAAGTESILIEIHRFASRYQSDPGGGGDWEAGVEWTVRVTNAGGRTLTEFEANEEVSRPNYRGSDNEKESLSEAYHKALERTTKGLRALPAIDAIRLPSGTAQPTVPSDTRALPDSK